MFLRFKLIVALLLLSPISLPAQQPGETGFLDTSEMPSGRAGELLQAVIDAVNSDDPEQIKSFIREQCTESFAAFAPLDEHVSVFRRQFHRTGGIDFHSMRTYTPPREDEHVAIVKDRHFGSWRGIVFSLDADQQRISGLQFTGARTPTNVDEPRLTFEEMLEQVDGVLKKLSDKDVFSGTALIAKGNDVVYQFAAGEASKRFHVLNRVDTKFNLGSMNKMFTSTAIAQLVEQGKLSYDDTIDAFVDEQWLPSDVTSQITVHHLLSHTSGLGSYFNDMYWNSSRENFRTVADFQSLVRDERPAFEPGSRFRYSNTGMLLLGVVIEKVSGQSYFEYIRHHVYRPAGMANSDSFEMDYPVENLAIGYIPAPDSPYGWQNNLFKHVIKGGPAGGGFSTVEDLHRFSVALRDGTLLTPESLDRMWTDHAQSNYGYGFSVERGPVGLVVGHGGGFPGLNGNLDILVDHNMTVAVLANYDGAASPVATAIKGLLARTLPDEQ